MSSRRAKARKQFIGRFVAFEYLMMKTPVFGALSGESVKLLLFICMRNDGANNGNIPFSVREAAEALSVNPNTAGKKFQQLVEHGFLAVVSKGAFSVKNRQATLWRITFYPSIGGQPATRDYTRWKGPQKQNTVLKNRENGIKKALRATHEEPKSEPAVLAFNTVAPI